jgi:hypothetical protein
MLSGVIGMALVLKRRYFSAFMIGTFAAFFISHEIIICYDDKAIEMGRELGPDGWFRLVAMVFHDAMNVSHGSFWAVTGSSLALIAILVGWPLKIYHDNKAAVPANEPLRYEAESSADYAETEADENSDDSTEFDEYYDATDDDENDEIT